MDVNLKGRMKRLAPVFLLSMASTVHAESVPQSGLEYLSVEELGNRMQRGQLDAVTLVQYLQQRIDALDKNGPAINSIIELNPDAQVIAQSLDLERQQGRVRSPLHGIPVLLKDNIDTSDQMQTSAGSLAMVGIPAAQDAYIVQRLRAAGAVILGKTNLSEWAHFRDIEIPSGWSGRGGQTKNPHVLSETPCGSSSGSGAAVAAGFAPLTVGTETSGSIVCPASLNGVVGLKPTVGLLSRSGIIAATHKLDTPGPMARTVRDAALLLNAMTGNDKTDPAQPPLALKGLDYTAALLPGSLVGKRIGFPVEFDTGGEAADSDPQFSKALEVMQAAGATLVPVDLKDPESARVGEGFAMGLKHHLPAYLATRTGLAVSSLEELLQFNIRKPGKEGYGQSILSEAQAVAFDEAAYNALWQHIQSENAAAIDAVLTTHKLDGVVSDVGSAGMNVIPLAGYPAIMVPSGMDDSGLPTSVFFYGPRWSEASLLALAYGYEQASQERREPGFKP
jgi:amidase